MEMGTETKLGPQVALEMYEKMRQSVNKLADLDSFCKAELLAVIAFRNRLLEKKSKNIPSTRKSNDNKDNQEVPPKKRQRSTKPPPTVPQTDTSTPNASCIESVIAEVRFSTNFTHIYSEIHEKPTTVSRADPNDSYSINLNLPKSDDGTIAELGSAEKENADPIMPPPKTLQAKSRRKRAKKDLQESISDSENDVTVTRSGRTIKKPDRKINSTRVTRAASKLNSSENIIIKNDETLMPPPKKTRKRPAKKDVDLCESETDGDLTVKKLAKNVKTTLVPEVKHSRVTRATTTNTKTNETANIEKIELKSLDTSTTSTIAESDTSFEKKPTKKKGRKAKLKTPNEPTPIESKTNQDLSIVSAVVESDNSFEKKSKKGTSKKLKSKKTVDESAEKCPEKIEDTKESPQPSSDAKTVDLVINNIENPENKQEKIVELKIDSPVKNRKSVPKSEKTMNYEFVIESDEVDRKTLTSSNSTPKKDNVTLIVEVNNIEPAQIETDSYQMNSPAVISKASDETVVITTEKSIEKKPALDETIIISGTCDKDEKSPVLSKKEHQFDETIVISKNNDNSMDSNKVSVKVTPDHSVLNDDASEIEDTPVKVIMPSIMPLKKNQIFESPVKSKVRHFEKLAEAHSKQTAPIPTNKVKTQKTRANSQIKIQQNEQYIEVISDSPDFVPSKTKIARWTPSNVKTVGNVPIPQVSKDISIASSKNFHGSSSKLFSPNNGMTKTVTQLPQTKDPSVLKRELQLKKIEEQKKKREEKFRAAALAREAQEKLKLAAIEKNIKEKNEKQKHPHHEMEEKLKEEAEKKKLARLAQLEELRRQEAEIRARIMAQKIENRRQQQLQEKEMIKKNDKENLLKYATTNSGDLSMYKKLITNVRVSNYMPQSDKLFDEIMELDEELEAKDASSSEKAKACERLKPAWAKKITIDGIAKHQRYLESKLIDKLYSVRVFSPDLVEIFPGIDRAKLKRTSSAVWKTPPRCSMMPK